MMAIRLTVAGAMDKDKSIDIALRFLAVLFILAVVLFVEFGWLVF
jgi:hypothetical protein